MIENLEHLNSLCFLGTHANEWDAQYFEFFKDLPKFFATHWSTVAMVEWIQSS